MFSLNSKAQGWAKRLYLLSPCVKKLKFCNILKYRTLELSEWEDYSISINIFIDLWCAQNIKKGIFH